MTTELESRLLQLPRHERARLAEKLLSSLDEHDEVEEAWIGEAERRLEEVHSGRVTPVTYESVLSEARSRPL